MNAEPTRGLSHRGYSGSAHYEPDDHVFHGRVLDINDVVSYQGASVAELEAAFREAVEDYLDHCEQIGKQPDRPFSGRLVLRLDSEIHRRAHVHAERAGTSLNRWIASAVERALAS